MKIKDLINELSKFNPETPLMFSNHIECFRSDSGCAFVADYKLLDFTKKEFKQEVMEMGFDVEDEKEYKEEIIQECGKDGVVVLQVSGEENWNQ